MVTIIGQILTRSTLSSNLWRIKKFEPPFSRVNFNFSVSLGNTKITQIIVIVEDWYHLYLCLPVSNLLSKCSEIPLLKKRGCKSCIISELLHQECLFCFFNLLLGSLFIY